MPSALEEAIRTRRTHKAFRPEPVPRETLDELLELARWAPNHNLTNPWRFRVIGPKALAALKEGAGAPGEGAARADAGQRLRNVSRVISRDAALAALAEESFDVVVVGGGITGAGVALDAATRGYSVALVERRDFAAGTSSRSSKL